MKSTGRLKIALVLDNLQETARLISFSFEWSLDLIISCYDLPNIMKKNTLSKELWKCKENRLKINNPYNLKIRVQVEEHGDMRQRSKAKRSRCTGGHLSHAGPRNTFNFWSWHMSLVDRPDPNRPKVHATQIQHSNPLTQPTRYMDLWKCATC